VVALSLKSDLESSSDLEIKGNNFAIWLSGSALLAQLSFENYTPGLERVRIQSIFWTPLPVYLFLHTSWFKYILSGEKSFLKI